MKSLVYVKHFDSSAVGGGLAFEIIKAKEKAIQMERKDLLKKVNEEEDARASSNILVLGIGVGRKNDRN